MLCGYVGQAVAQLLIVRVLHYYSGWLQVMHGGSQASPAVAWQRHGGVARRLRKLRSICCHDNGIAGRPKSLIQQDGCYPAQLFSRFVKLRNAAVVRHQSGDEIEAEDASEADSARKLRGCQLEDSGDDQYCRDWK